MTTKANENLATLAPQPRPGLSLVGAPRSISLQDYECFIGVSTNVTELKEFVSVQASQWQPTLLIGERGLRQEKIARALHQASEYWAQPFFAVNAHGLSSDALHALLFGPQGVMETFHHGTIFINELVSLPLLLQQRFAVYLEEQRWRNRPAQANRQRLIFSTEWNPSEMNAGNRIAYGLIEMLRSSSFMIKPLRERSEDIPYLASRLVERITQRLNKGAHDISPTAMKMLTEYVWERNIDELEEILESAISRTPPHQIDESLLPTRIRYATFKSIPASGIDLPQMVDDYERALIETALSQTNGNQTKAAALLGLRVQTLNMKLKRFAEQKKD
ncbi:MAG TPA: sigma 54-interacting transcriptional regulator [Blastocatellia bacterium]|nr:sigma 54-interacting transcriptional regulator [Blastocatellia bacterium]